MTTCSNHQCDHYDVFRESCLIGLLNPTDVADGVRQVTMKGVKILCDQCRLRTKILKQYEENQEVLEKVLNRE